jgi:hypothetical protein
MFKKRWFNKYLLDTIILFVLQFVAIAISGLFLGMHHIILAVVAIVISTLMYFLRQIASLHWTESQK